MSRIVLVGTIGRVPKVRSACIKQKGPGARMAGEAGHVELATVTGDARVDSRLLALQLRNQHKNLMALIERYADQFRDFGHLPFQTEVGYRELGGGKAMRFVMLNEDQAFFLLALARNTDHVVQLKARLITAFGEARRAAQQQSAEYLPSYHTLHETIADKAAGSRNGRFVHMSINRLVNEAFGLKAGQGPLAPMAKRAMLIVVQSVAAQAMRAAVDHHDGYQRAKKAVQSLCRAVEIGS